MRLCIIMSPISPWSRRVALRLAELGHEVHVVYFALNKRTGFRYLNADDSFQAEEIRLLGEKVASMHTVAEGPMLGVGLLRPAHGLRRIAQDRGIDVVLSLYGGRYALLAWLSGIRPYAVYLVGSDVLKAGLVAKAIGRVTIGAASRAFANGRYLASQARSVLSRNDVEALYLGVDTSMFSPRPKGGSTLSIVCTRGFLPIYNNGYLIEGLASMRHNVPPFRVTFVSRGPCLEEARETAMRVLPPDIASGVEFLNGIATAELVERLSSADIYVSMSRSDGTSISLLEAMASGAFPVLSDIPANREWVNEEMRNGILVPLDRPDLLGRALERAMVDAEWRRIACEYNREQVVLHADSRTNTEILVSRLQESLRLIRQPGRRG